MLFRKVWISLCAAVCVLAALAGGPQAVGQSIFGSISGLVTDSTDAPIAGATVTLTNIETRETRTAQTEGAGEYQFTYLKPGSYRIDIENSGFKRFSQENVQVLVDQASRVVSVLQVGSLTEQVVVTAQAPLVQSENASVGQVIEGRGVQELPLNGRNPLNLTAIVPGVVPGGGTGGSLTGQNVFAAGNYQIGGGTANQSSTLIDGAPVNVAYGNSVILVPSQDVVQEFRVQTNNNTAEYGMYTGGVINMTTRSGSNSVHGSAYEFVRNTILNADTFFGKRTGQPKQTFHQNQFGGTVGAPIMKNRWFVFGAYEGFRQSFGALYVVSVPTLGMLSGDFSDYRNAATGNVVPIYDPLTTCGFNNNPACTPQQTSSGVLRQQFAGNIIPASRINPIAKAALNFPYYAKPNRAGDPYTHFNNFSTYATAGGNNDQYTLRSDQKVGEKHQIFERYSWWRSRNFSANPYGNDLRPGSPVDPESFKTNQIVLGDTYLVNPTTVADLRVSFTRWNYIRIPGTLGFNPTSLGLPSYFNNIPAMNGVSPSTTMPVFSVSGYSSGSNGVYRSINNNYVIAPTLSKTFGPHTVKVGADLRKLEWFYFQTSFPGGQFSFDNVFTSERGGSSAGPSGNSFASFLLGYPASGQVIFAPPVSTYMYYQGYFAQDTWRATPKLTITAGIRYEIPGTYTERNLKQVDFNPTELNPATSGILVNGNPVMGAFDLVGTPTNPQKGLRVEHFANFSPRIGVAYRVTENTVVRTGFGTFFIPTDTQFQEGPHNSAIGNIANPMVASINSNQTPQDTLSNPFPNGFVGPPGRSPNYQSVLLGNNLNAMKRKEENGLTYQWNLAVQHQFTHSFLKDMSVDLAYVGLHGSHLPNQVQQNQLPESVRQQFIATPASQQSQLIAQVPNPFYGTVQVGALSKPTIQANYLKRPFPQYGNLNNLGNYVGYSNYNALQAKVEKRMPHGGSIIGAYTFSKLMANVESLTGWLDTLATAQDFNNLNAEYSLSSQDARQRFTVAYVYDLPFGRGQSILSNVSGIMDKLVSGWGFNGLTTLQKGFPLGLSTSGVSTAANLFSGTLRPNVVPGCNKVIDGPIQQRLGGSNGPKRYFNIACFTVPGSGQNGDTSPLYSFGNESRTDSLLRGPGVANWDLALSKKTRLTEQLNMEFRAEAFNLFNRVQFALPNRTITTAANATAGQITSTQGTPRVIQLALRVRY